MEGWVISEWVDGRMLGSWEMNGWVDGRTDVR